MIYGTKEAVVEFEKELEVMYGSSKRKDKEIAYKKKTVESVALLSDGSIFEIEKPSLETDFCFGYADNMGVSSEEAEHTRRSFLHKEQNFIDRNTESIDKTISTLEDPDSVYAILLQEAHYNSHRLVDLKFISRSGWSVDDERYMLNGTMKEGWHRLSDEDMKTVIAALKDSRARLVKRLNAYLKRYGTSKLRTWTYWID